LEIIWNTSPPQRIIESCACFIEANLPAAEIYISGQQGELTNVTTLAMARVYKSPAFYNLPYFLENKPRLILFTKEFFGLLLNRLIFEVFSKKEKII